MAYFPVWDKFHFGDTRIYIPVELPSFCGSITSFSVIDSSAPYHMVIHAVEQFDGKNYLHIEVDIPNDMYDAINYNIRFRIGYTPSGIEESGLPVIGGYEVYPNPSKGNAVIKFGLNKRSDISLSLYDITGRRLKNIYSGTQEQGSHEFLLNKER